MIKNFLSTCLMIAIGAALVIAAVHLGSVAHAQGSGSAMGSAAGSAAPAPTITAIDPTQDPGGFLGELGAAKKAGWPVLIGLIAFGLAKGFALLLPSLNKGRTAIAIAGAAAIGAAVIAAGTGAASWSSLLGALVPAVVAFIDFKAPTS